MNFSFDLKFGNNIIGVDEVGRGCLAGPVFAAAIRLDQDNFPKEMNDSKKLSILQRMRIFKELAKKGADEAKLQGLTHLTVPFGNGTGIFRIQDVFLVPGQRVRFDTAAEGVSVEVTAEGVTVSGDEQAPGGRRRLMQDMFHWLHSRGHGPRRGT